MRSPLLVFLTSSPRNTGCRTLLSLPNTTLLQSVATAERLTLLPATEHDLTATVAAQQRRSSDRSGVEYNTTVLSPLTLLQHRHGLHADTTNTATAASERRAFTVQLRVATASRRAAAAAAASREPAERPGGTSRLAAPPPPTEGCGSSGPVTKWNRGWVGKTRHGASARPGGGERGGQGQSQRTLRYG